MNNLRRERLKKTYQIMKLKAFKKNLMQPNWQIKANKPTGQGEARYSCNQCDHIGQTKSGQREIP